MSLLSPTFLHSHDPSENPILAPHHIPKSPESQPSSHSPAVLLTLFSQLYSAVKTKTEALFQVLSQQGFFMIGNNRTETI